MVPFPKRCGNNIFSSSQSRRGNLFHSSWLKGLTNEFWLLTHLISLTASHSQLWPPEFCKKWVLTFIWPINKPDIRHCLSTSNIPKSAWHLILLTPPYRPYYWVDILKYNMSDTYYIVRWPSTIISCWLIQYFPICFFFTWTHFAASSISYYWSLSGKLLWPE